MSKKKPEEEEDNILPRNVGIRLGQCCSTFVSPRPSKFFHLQDEGPVPTALLVNTFPFFKFIVH